MGADSKAREIIAQELNYPINWHVSDENTKQFFAETSPNVNNVTSAAMAQLHDQKAAKIEARALQREVKRRKVQMERRAPIVESIAGPTAGPSMFPSFISPTLDLDEPIRTRVSHIYQIKSKPKKGM